ncbi:hypothetical protein ABPG74_003316 [Tetrahymena malaccensis]
MNGFQHMQVVNQLNTKQDQFQQQLQHHKNKETNSQIISYQYCSKGGYHTGELLNCVCIDEKCSQNELICSFCEQENHQGHLIIPFKVFLESLQSMQIDNSEGSNQMGEEQKVNLENFQNMQQNSSPNIDPSKANKNIDRDQFDFYLDEIDRQHQITIKYFHDYQTKVLEGFNECMNKINQFYKAVKSELQRKQYLEETCFQKLLKSLSNYSSTIQDATVQLSNPFNEENALNMLNKDQQNLRNNRRNKRNNIQATQSSQDIKEVLKIIGFNQNDNFKSYYKFDLNHIVQLCESRQQKLMAGKESDGLLVQLKALVSKCDFLYGEIPSLSIQITSSQGFGLSGFLKQLRFSDKLKGTSIQIKSPNLAQQTQNESSGQRFCLLEPNLPHNSRLRWGFRIKSLIGWIGIGICLSGIIKGFNYHFKYSKIGHGSYLLSGNGYTWSHSKADQNSQNKSFHFITGDTIYIEFDPQEKKLKFLKGKSNEKYTLEVEFLPTDEIVPCVNLCSSGDEIELIINEAELMALNF